MEVRQMTSAHRAPLAALLGRITQFKADEVEVALELVDAALREGPTSGYECLVALDDGSAARDVLRDPSPGGAAALAPGIPSRNRPEGELCGYICFGPTPMTEATWDLYWIAVVPDVQGRGIGRSLFEAFAERMRARGGRQVRIETSSQESYTATGGFYERLGFRLEARLRDFYALGDDLLIFYRQLA